MRGAQGLKKKQEIPLSWLFLTPVLLWSTVFPLSKILLEVIPPTSLAAIRFSIGGGVMLLYVAYAFSWREALLSLRRSWKDFVLLGFIGIFANNLLQNLGLSLTSASSASLLGTVDPVFTAILSAIFLGEPLTRSKLSGLMVAFVGVLIVTTNGQWVGDWGESLGNILVVGAAMGYSAYTILSKKVLHREQPPMVVAWATTVGALFLIVAALLIDAGRPYGALNIGHIATLAYLSIAPTSVAVVAYFYLLQRIQASQASVIIATVWGTKHWPSRHPSLLEYCPHFRGGSRLFLPAPTHSSFPGLCYSLSDPSLGRVLGGCAPRRRADLGHASGRLTHHLGSVDDHATSIFLPTDLERCREAKGL